MRRHDSRLIDCVISVLSRAAPKPVPHHHTLSQPPTQVVPPAGWRARSTPYPDLETVWINTPIRQHVFGKAGAYRCGPAATQG